MATDKYQRWSSVVTLSAIALTVCFMIWMMFAVIGISNKQILWLNETQSVTTPVFAGLLTGLPLGGGD
ncbi:MAG: hypothetical protein AB7E73_17075 [Burkholderiales bacterium]